MEINTPHESYVAHMDQWKRVRDTIAGSDRIKKASTDYLPQPTGMEAPHYEAYVSRARFYDVTDRTLFGLTGAIFRREPQVEAPPKVEKSLDQLSARGLTFNGQARAITREVLSVGRVGGLLDMGPEPQAVGTMPKLAIYDAETIIDWNTESVGGTHKLVRVVLEEPEDQNEKSDRKQYRELVIEDGAYKVNIWRKIENTPETPRKANAEPEEPQWKIVEVFEPMMGQQRLDFIPFVFFGVNDLDPDIEKPPLLGLVDENIGHYQLQADYRQALFLTAQPTPYVLGFEKDEEPEAIGSGDVWFSKNPNAKVGMLEFQGAGIEATRQAILDSEVRMVLLGARFFEANKKAAETAETIRLRFSADASILAVISQQIGEGLTKILRWAAEWASQAAEQISVRMNDDFVAIPLEPDQIRAYLQAWQAGAMAFTDLFALLQRGDMIAESRTEEEVQAETETEPPEIPEGGEPLEEPEDEDETESQAA